MSESLFVFTIAGVQSFIGQARRLGDLVAGSKLVSELAGAAAQGIEGAGGALIFPPTVREVDGAQPSFPYPTAEGMPNTLVARTPAGSEAAVGRAAREALESHFRRTAGRAREHLARSGPSPDPAWEEIWERQCATAWDSYWAAAPLTGRKYAEAYEDVRRALDGCKRTRAFPQAVEEGWKDTLGGTRSALHTAALSAPEYWKAVAERHTAPELRPDGRERLDSPGTVKRFGGLAGGIPSVSEVAASSFLTRVKHSPCLRAYRVASEALLGDRLHRVSDRAEWPYDGDLFYPDTLTPRRLRTSYGVEDPDPRALHAALEALQELRKAAGSPSAYYGLILLDGDNMGQQVSACSSAEEHAQFSRRVGRFAAAVKGVVDSAGEGARLVYAGGDDVLALAPLELALPLGSALADRFKEMITGGSASAGIALVHHLHPLDSALAEAHEAERAAKAVTGKGAVGIRVVKRSGETVAARARWERVGDTWQRLRGHFAEGALAGRFAGEAARTVEQLAKAPAAMAPELARLVVRHRPPDRTEPGAELAGELAAWEQEMREGGGELGPWILLARFVGGGGAE